MTPDPTEQPEDDDPGQASPDIGDGSGCTNYGEPPCNCIYVTANGLHVSRILVSIRSHDSNIVGRWKVNRNGHLFVRSSVVTVGGRSSWEWNKDWTFADGDVLCGGFWKSTGGWFNAPGGCAAVTIHA